MLKSAHSGSFSLPVPIMTVSNPRAPLRLRYYPHAVRQAAVLAAMLLVAAAASAAPSGQLKAFARAAGATDALPMTYPLPTRFGRIVATRRIATYDGGPKRRARLFLLRTSGG